MKNSARFIPGIADFSYCLNKWKYRSMRDPEILTEVENLKGKAFQLDFLFNHDGGEQNRAEIHRRASDAALLLTGADYGPPSVERFRKQADAARTLDMRVVRHAWGPFLGFQEPLPLAKLEKGLRDAARIYENAGLLYALENHQDYPAADLVSVFESIGSSHIGIFLDTGNSIALLEDPVETARALAPFTLGVHVKEYAVLPAPGGFDLVGVLLGKGVVDNAAILKTVAEKAPAGSIPLLLENPIERCRINVFSEPYRRHMGERTLAGLKAVANLMERSQALFPNGITLPFENPMIAPEQVQQIEREQNREAYAGLLKLLSSLP